MSLSGVKPLEDARDDTQRSGHGAESGFDRGHVVKTLVRREQCVQSRRGIRVTDKRARVGEQADAEEPLGVDMLVTEVVCHQFIERGTGIALAAELAVYV